MAKSNPRPPENGYLHQKVLDHGLVALKDSMGDDHRIVEAARVLLEAPVRDLEDPKLIRYCLTNHHTSPFEHVQFTFYVKAPIFVFRQWHRHRTWSFNEVSARYKELSAEFYVPKPEHIGVQSEKNHQSRVIEPGAFDPGAIGIRSWIHEACTVSFAAYQGLLADGCPREIARGVLPMNTYSEMYATVDLHNLMNFLRLRCDEHAQYEIRVYADAMLDLIGGIVPDTIAVFKEMLNG